MSLDKIRLKLDDMAEALLTEAMKDSTTLDRKLDVFKFVQQYYLGAQKATKGGAEPPDHGSTMEGLRHSVQEPASQQGEEDDDET